MSARIYVACLASYNAGRLFGEWIDLDGHDSDTLAEAIQAVIAKSPTSGADEWAIHAHEGFEGITISENPDLEDLFLHARMLEEYGGAWSAYVDWGAECDPTEDGFTDRFCGEYPSAEEYAEDLARDCGYLEGCDKNPLLNYVDWERFARDLQMGGDYYFADSPGGVYVFRST